MGAVDSEDCGAVVCEEEAGEGACGGKGELGMVERIRWGEGGVPGAKPASSSTRRPVSGGGADILCCGLSLEQVYKVVDGRSTHLQ